MLRWLALCVGLSLARSSVLHVDMSRQGHGYRLGGNTFSGSLDSPVPALDMSMVRFWGGADTSGEYPIKATEAEMSAFVYKRLPVNSSGATALRDYFANLTQSGVTVLLGGGSMPNNYVDSKHNFLSERVDDAALMWTCWISRLTAPDVRLPARHFMELTNEPNGNWNTYIRPHDWAKLACTLRDLLDKQGLASAAISGPGTSLGFGEPFLEALAAFPGGGLRCLGLISVHSWEWVHTDPCGPSCMNANLTRYAAIRAKLDPTHSKPWVSTEYGTRTDEIMGHVFNHSVEGPGAPCYANASASLPPDAESLSPLYAARAVAMTLLHMNHDFDGGLYWWLHDYTWLGSCFGLVSRNNTPTAANIAFRDMFNTAPFQLRGSVTVERQWEDDDTVQTLALQGSPLASALLWIAHMPTQQQDTLHRQLALSSLPFPAGSDSHVACFPVGSGCSATVLTVNATTFINVTVPAGTLLAVAVVPQ